MSQPKTLEEACRAYAELRPVFKRAADKVAAEVAEVATARGFMVKMSARAKTVDSFVKKAVGKAYGDGTWAKTTDKAGARAIVFDPGALYPLADALEERWHDREAAPREDKRLNLDEKSFDYSGIHLHVVVPGAEAYGQPIRCEVQLRTAAQDAWAVLDHEFVYKGLVDVPPEAKRAMVRAVALIETFDEEVKRVVDSAVTNPQYPLASLIHAAEKAYYSIATTRYNASLTALITSQLLPAIADDDRPGYAERLQRFTADNRARILELLERCSDIAAEPRYALLTQPEAMVLFERAENAEMLLSSVIEQAGPDLARLVGPVLAAWGKPLTA